MVGSLARVLRSEVNGVERWLSQQAPRKWSTRAASGTKSASVAACAKCPSAPSRSSLATPTSTAPDATRRSSPLAALNVPRYDWVFFSPFGCRFFYQRRVLRSACCGLSSGGPPTISSVLSPQSRPRPIRFVTY